MSVVPRRLLLQCCSAPSPAFSVPSRCRSRLLQVTTTLRLIFTFSAAKFYSGPCRRYCCCHSQLSSVQLRHGIVTPWPRSSASLSHLHCCRICSLFLLLVVIFLIVSVLPHRSPATVPPQQCSATKFFLHFRFPNFSLPTSL